MFLYDIPLPDEPRSLVIVGAGSQTGDLIELVREQPLFRLSGIIDPVPSLRGQFVQDVPVLGWLSDLPRHVSHAVIGTPASPQAFDRDAVFRILTMQGVTLPIFMAASSRCDPDVTLRRGTVLLGHSVVESGAALGENCLVGVGAVVERCARVPDHSVLMQGCRVSALVERTASSPAPRSLSATLASERETIQEILRRINWACMEIVLVLDDEGVLIGTITDGDIRRGILAGVAVSEPVPIIMNRHPVTVAVGTPYGKMLEIMRSRSIRHLPVVDSGGRPLRLERMETVVDHLSGSDAVVMAGGLGMRLRPLTEDTPKPLLPVGGRPILDHILEGLHRSGIEDVVISLNYLGDRIREHVGSGRDHGLNVQYVNETQRLGTAGALSLLHPRPRKPFVVMNGDLLTEVRFAKVLEYQREHDCPMVVCVRQYRQQVPYGVVELDEGRVSGIREKPVYEHFINAGVYALRPECLDYIPAETFFDMTDLLSTLLKEGLHVGAFPVIEYWRDIGTPEDLSAATRDQEALKRSESSVCTEAVEVTL